MNDLKNIIFNTNEKPTIVNNDSNFVVVTYWWGRNNLNNNTARPCVSYYEDLFKNIIKFSVNLLKTLTKLESANEEMIKTKLDEVKNKLETITETRQFKMLLNRKIREYYTNIYEYAKIPDNSSNKYNLALQFLEKNKLSGKTPQHFEFKNTEYLFVIFSFIAKEFIRINKQNILDLVNNKIVVENLKQSFLNKEVNNNTDYKNKLNEIKNEETRINNLIKKSLTVKNTYELLPTSSKNANFIKYLNKIYEDPEIQNKSLNEIMIQELRYLSPLKFEEMIENWKNQCAKNNIWLVFMSSVGVYAPAETFVEDSVWKTLPGEADWFPSWSKRMGEILLEAYRVQYNYHNWAIIRPANIFGEYDDFSGKGTVIASTIKKIVEARGDSIEAWGDGSPIRDFVYGGDVADAVLDLYKRKLHTTINFGAGEEITIKQMIESLIRISGKDLKIDWNTSKPNGDSRRQMDTTKQEQVGLLPKLGFEKALEKTYEYYISHNL